MCSQAARVGGMNWLSVGHGFLFLGVGARDRTRRIRDAAGYATNNCVAKLVVLVWPRHSGVEGQCQQVYGHD